MPPILRSFARRTSYTGPTAQLYSQERTAHFLLRGPPFRPWWLEPCDPQEVRMLRLAQLWSFLSFLWTDLKPTAAGSGDNGSGLEPNG
jgi:hypothetical protein